MCPATRNWPPVEQDGGLDGTESIPQERAQQMTASAGQQGSANHDAGDGIQPDARGPLHEYISIGAKTCRWPSSHRFSHIRSTRLRALRNGELLPRPVPLGRVSAAPGSSRRPKIASRFGHWATSKGVAFLFDLQRRELCAAPEGAGGTPPFFPQKMFGVMFG